MVDDRQKARRRDDLDLAGSGGLAAQAAGQMTPLPRPAAASEASSTPATPVSEPSSASSPSAMYDPSSHIWECQRYGGRLPPWQGREDALSDAEARPDRHYESDGRASYGNQVRWTLTTTGASLRHNE
jgi:hypothetical protein